MTAVDRLRESLEDPRWTMELWLLGQALVEIADKLNDKPSTDA